MMRRLTLRILVALLTFAIGVAAASVWMVSRIAESEEPPCRSCSEIYTSSEISTVTFRELSANPGEFRGKLVRVEAIFHHDSGAISLRGERWAGPGAMYAGVAESRGACPGAWKALTVYSGYRTWYDSEADVVVVGRLERIDGEGDFYAGREGFNILCLERVEPIGSGIRQRVYYAIGRLAGAIY